MIRVTDARPVQNGVATYFEYAGIHTDTKPTEKVATGSLFVEVDTGDVYIYDEASTTWNKLCSFGGDA